MRGVFVLAAVVVVAAGCGSTAAVVTKTRVLQPCASAKSMARCVQSIVVEYARIAGFPTGGMRSRCALHGARWSCAVLTQDELGHPDCRRVDALETTLGLPVVLGMAVVYDGSCDRWTS